ncbi:hypothetical protein A3K63_01715 [Candidatus Micrarchaeota archaeon RBG_16_49_10]|nr:MAG: hypothetical protein A3K63_01715 [Candidatus Micrarchaeota archaeon RBG_16_49_10]
MDLQKILPFVVVGAILLLAVYMFSFGSITNFFSTLGYSHLLGRDVTYCMGESFCRDGDFCDFEKGKCGESGDCVKIPTFCIFSRGGPVCGCDGETYSSDCARKQAKVSKLHDGEC